MLMLMRGVGRGVLSLTREGGHGVCSLFIDEKKLEQPVRQHLQVNGSVAVATSGSKVTTHAYADIWKYIDWLVKNNEGKLWVR